MFYHIFHTCVQFLQHQCSSFLQFCILNSDLGSMTVQLHMLQLQTFQPRLYNSKTFQPQDLTTPRLYNSQTLQPQDFTTPSISTPRLYNPKILQPQDFSTPRLYNPRCYNPNCNNIQNCFLHFSDLTVATLLSCATTTRLGIERMSFCVSKVRFVRLGLVSLGPGGP